AVSPTGVRGLMQLTTGTAALMRVANREDPIQSIRGGAGYFRMLMDQLPEEDQAARPHLAGPGRLQPWHRPRARRPHPDQEEWRQSQPLDRRARLAAAADQAALVQPDPLRLCPRLRGHDLRRQHPHLLRHAGLPDRRADDRRESPGARGTGAAEGSAQHQFAAVVAETSAPLARLRERGWGRGFL
ncbi:hypothetical protein D3874_27615, partial [Oleomonas cavernae]